MISKIVNEFAHACDIFKDYCELDIEYSELVMNDKLVEANLKPILQCDEEYRYIKGFPTYVITNFGRVININTLRVLKPIKRQVNMCGNYVRYVVGLSKRGKHYIKPIHQLVAEAFLDKPENIINPVIDHIDHNTANNYYNNLRWISKSENSSNKITNKYTHLSLNELYELRKQYECKSPQYATLSTVIKRRRKK